MAAFQRILWLHSQLEQIAYPNAKNIADYFEISHRQAQRDIEYLQDSLNAPLQYSFSKKGYYYTNDFILPTFFLSQHEREMLQKMAAYYSSMNEIGVYEYANYAALFNKLAGNTTCNEELTIMPITPYSAKIQILDCRYNYRLLEKFKRAQLDQYTFVYEFHNVELFLGLLITTGADFKILSPNWLRNMLYERAKNIIKNIE